jgi:phosphonate transport system substrate-binding protein
VVRSTGEKKTFAFGIVMSDASRRVLFQRVCEHLGRRLGGVVYPQLARTYVELEDLVMNGSVEIAWTPPLVAADLVERKAALVAVVSKRDNAAQYRAVVFVRRNSGILTVRDLQGASVAWVEPTSASGYIVPRAWLRDNGSPPDELFGQQFIVGSHGAVARAVLNGEVNAGATFALFTLGLRTTIQAGWTELDPASADDVHVVVNAGIVPADCISVSSKLTVPVRERIAEAFIGLEPEQLADFRKVLGAEGYEKPPVAHGQSLRRLRLEAMRTAIAKRSG